MLNIPQSDLQILNDLVRREGGFIDHPADKGGATKFGITGQTLGAFRELGRLASNDEVASLSRAEAQHILYSQYVVAPGFTQVQHASLRALLIDSAVHSGVGTAVKWLQESLGVKVDGLLGPVTRAALDQSDVALIYRRLLALRLEFLGRLITEDPKQAVFAAGWMKRVAQWIVQEA